MNLLRVAVLSSANHRFVWVPELWFLRQPDGMMEKSIGQPDQRNDQANHGHWLERELLVCFPTYNRISQQTNSLLTHTPQNQSESIRPIQHLISMWSKQHRGDLEDSRVHKLRAGSISILFPLSLSSVFALFLTRPLLHIDREWHRHQPTSSL